jgi:nucleotide-binding universal stress UspA family protein
MYDDVLIPTDGSKGVEPAIRHGLGVANRFDSTVHTIHVVDLTDIQGELLPQIPPEWRQAGDHATQVIANEAAKLGIDAITNVDHGTPFKRILDYVDNHGIDLVTIGTHGRSGLERYLLGSVTERVVGGSPVPVLCVPRTDERPASLPDDITYDRILVPTDGSKGARQATKHAIEFARAYDATVHALNVVNRRSFATRPGTEWDELEASLEDSGETATKYVADAADDAGLSTVTTVQDGVPHRMIAEYATEEVIDLIAMGTHGRSGLSKWMLGSVTERVLQTSEIPVLTVRSG